MLNRPQVKKCYTVEIVEPDEVFLLGERVQQVFTGPLHREIWPLLTGEHTSIELIGKLEDRFPFHHVIGFLHDMEREGYLIEAGSSNLPDSEAAFYHALDVDTDVALKRVRSTTVSVHALADDHDSRLKAALVKAGIKIQACGELDVFVTNDYLDERLSSLNVRQFEARKPWMLVALSGTRIWLGPIFSAEGSPCWACLAERLRSNRQMASYIIRKQQRDASLNPPERSSATAHAVGASIAALEIAKYIVQPKRSRLLDHIVTLDLLELETKGHRVVARPQCPVCGKGEAWLPRSDIHLSARPKSLSFAGERLFVPAQNTLERYAHHISPITGVIAWLTETTVDRSGLSYTYSAGHAFPLIQDDVEWLVRSVRSNTGGKGTTQQQAQVSAMGEAFERYSISYHGDEPSIWRSHREIGSSAVGLRGCMNFSDLQYCNRRSWNASLRGARLNVVPRPLDEDQEIQWVRAWSLSQQRECWLPASYCFVGHPESRTHFFSSADSNGCAAGNTPEDAILRGFLELVERDSVAIWWYNRIRRPEVNAASFCPQYFPALKAHYATLNREVWVLDLTSDLGIPTFVAISYKPSQAAQDIILGCGAHLNPKAAMLRALSELNQFLPVFRHGLGGKVEYDFPDEEAVVWWKTAKCEDEKYLLPVDACKNVADYIDLERDDLLDDIGVCLDVVREVGLELIALDHTRPEVGVPVWRIVVPGLRHFWRRLGSGRLYDVPVKLGWLDKATREEDMNPKSIFF